MDMESEEKDSQPSRRQEWHEVIDSNRESLMGFLELLGSSGSMKADTEMLERVEWLKGAYGAFFDGIGRYVDFCEDRLEALDI